VRPERTVSVPREERVHRPGVGGRRMDRGLVMSLHVGGFGSGRQDPDVTGQVQWRVRTRSPRNLPADQGQETGTGLTGWLRAGPEPAKSEFSPAHQAQDLPGHPDFQPLLLWSRGPLAVQGWFGRTPPRDSLPFSGPYGHPP